MSFSKSFSSGDFGHGSAFVIETGRVKSVLSDLIQAFRRAVPLERNPTQAAILFVIGFLILPWLVSNVRSYRRLRHFKGPRLAAVSKLWHLKTVVGPTAYLDFYEVLKEYGPLARVGPNDLINDDPEFARHILGVRSQYRRADWDEEEHGKLRSKMAAGYSGREVAGFEKKIDDNITRLFRLLEKSIDVDQPFDFGRKVQFFTLDVISDLAYGEPLGFMSNDKDMYDYLKSTEAALPVFMTLGVVPWVMKIFASPIFRSLMPSENDVVGFGKLMGIAKKISAERFGPDRIVQKDMLGSFINHGMTQEEAESEILVQVLAGSDTTATTIRATVLHTITTPRVYARLLEEIAQAAPNTSSPIISDAEARTLPYLQALIKEGLRIFPPVSAFAPKEVPAGGDVWKGRFIPGGTRIGWSAMALARREETWGKDAAEFRPERWIMREDGGICDSAEKLREMEGVHELIFSHGRHQCLGKPVAVMELNKVFFELFRRYDLSLCNPLKPWKSIHAGIHCQSEMWMRGHRRD
ncbi:benzoate 4-monooxygenase cytochrome p450 [Colletotrichum karsti]|uniref:Benzoate 4-monooxygenase cytochrome p450 n=1 Tax=Colletotrichum karsti TaxID=1095194 RepID=A0A9P6IFW8_9PEZI|nr:benzoate 4-monooxygenase cytochrome p450 [Colletotrichum karsti]KAF9882020.1 benzoate 4-monooxygenase cytochrome p450 [Colletotrichum karsti]